jgi:hypothetical protein
MSLASFASLEMEIVSTDDQKDAMMTLSCEAPGQGGTIPFSSGTLSCSISSSFAFSISSGGCYCCCCQWRACRHIDY